ncbi:MAG: sigma-54-dependent Fis family transcriptional regulator [Deltaproteobacteria bacterium]|nr:sigma-54-dependent Fis family transcriptional regulator [Deltaproteobacteria bacterium]
MLDLQLSHLDSDTLSVLRASNEADSTLLITGCTGTGKSHLAHVLHKASAKRCAGRWAKVNLATLSENLIESELFGHEKGAFTGADFRRVGRLEACDGGTVFLDEIGELTPRLQTKLLDFIQYKKVTPVGSNREVDIDVRIIVATNKDLEACVKAGEFRADLYHRLNVFHVRLPDLGGNARAIQRFAKKFFEERKKALGKNILGFSPEVERAFCSYMWPGNIRELENAIEYGVAVEKTNVLQAASLPKYLSAGAKAAEGAETKRGTLAGRRAGQAMMTAAEGGFEPRPGVIRVAEALEPRAVSFVEFPLTMDYHECKDVFEKTYLEQALRICRGQINLTSRSIGLNKVSLTEKIKKFGIDWKKIREECFGPGLRPSRGEGETADGARVV